MKRSKALGRGMRPKHGQPIGAPARMRLALGQTPLVFVLSLGYATDGFTQDASELQAQIERQRAENQALKDKIEQFERVLKTDVCKNPDAAKLLDEEPPAAPPPEPAPSQGK